MGCDTFHSEIPMVRGKPVIIKRLYNDKVLVEFTMGLGGRGICHTTITKQMYQKALEDNVTCGYR